LPLHQGDAQTLLCQPRRKGRPGLTRPDHYRVPLLWLQAVSSVCFA
jgi:hypothetical protein